MTAPNATGDIIADRVKHHAEAIALSARIWLSDYELEQVRERILSAVLDAYEEAYRAGADRAMQLVAERNPA